ncbi:hypothetical protein SAMN05216317_10155 [Nitrosomonas eutropha]|nr:hypothetical protein SAMN05216317_10155 [Nitrosomonas eutropha]
MLVRVKLFLSFLLTTQLVVMGMHFSHWSLEQGFTEFIENKYKEYYADHHGWNELLDHRPVANSQNGNEPEAENGNEVDRKYDASEPNIAGEDLDSTV